MLECNEAINSDGNTVRAQPCPAEIGREFVRQYYTMLSDQPEGMFRFYGIKSHFIRDGMGPVLGPQKIQMAIDGLNLKGCTVRIHTLSGCVAITGGLIIQVCGVLSTVEKSKRRFMQTFALHRQEEKKYYVDADMLTWLDQVFGTEVTSNTERGCETENTEETIKLDEKKEENDSPLESCKTEEVCVETDAEEDVRKEPGDEVTVDHQIAPHEREMPESDVAVDGKPRTWAKLVEGTAVPDAAASSQLTVVEPSPVSEDAPSEPPAPLHLPTSPGSSEKNPPPHVEQEKFDGSTKMERFARPSSLDNCRLYLGGIHRRCNPESRETAENEIREAFEHFGPVASVNVPIRFFGDSANVEQRTVFAFISMKTLEGAENAFQACHLARNSYFLPLKLSSFGFDGEATLCVQKNGRGGSVPRGMPAFRYPPGGMRGGGIQVASGRPMMRGGSRVRGSGKPWIDYRHIDPPPIPPSRPQQL